MSIALGNHPLVAFPLVAGVLLPDLDAVREDTHRSWALHTFLVPAIVYQLALRSGLLASTPSIGTALHFLTLGMTLHFGYDYVYPKEQTNAGSAWPVRPVGPSAPWGLLWLGVSWLLQWYFYLSPAFLPWLVGF